MAPIGYRLLEVARPRLLLCGDAAGYLSPLTGQGIEFAMRMGRLAARTTARRAGGRRLLGDALAARHACRVITRWAWLLRGEPDPTRSSQ